MSGNVQELCWLKDGKAVIRGGSFDSQEDSCAVYARGSVPTSARIKDTGFRVVRKQEFLIRAEEFNRFVYQRLRRDCWFCIKINVDEQRAAATCSAQS